MHSSASLVSASCVPGSTPDMKGQNTWWLPWRSWPLNEEIVLTLHLLWQVPASLPATSTAATRKISKGCTDERASCPASSVAVRTRWSQRLVGPEPAGAELCLGTRRTPRWKESRVLMFAVFTSEAFWAYFQCSMQREWQLHFLGCGELGTSHGPPRSPAFCVRAYCPFYKHYLLTHFWTTDPSVMKQ